MNGFALTLSGDPLHRPEYIYYNQILLAEKKTGIAGYKYHFMLKNKAPVPAFSCLQREVYFSRLTANKRFEELCRIHGIRMELCARFTTLA
ncbi:MAG: hypothetical protein LBT21_05450 [Oscillospiraceae bacterium]|jgi:hypothetical protein|nr:hypothetical protein [Oscillospiraceae bacterium]